MNKLAALAVILLGAALAIAPWNPLGEPNLHPSGWVVCAGVIVGALGGYLFAFRVRPSEPGFRVTGICIMLVMAGLGLVSLVL